MNRVLVEFTDSEVVSTARRNGEPMRVRKWPWSLHIQVWTAADVAGCVVDDMEQYGLTDWMVRYEANGDLGVSHLIRAERKKREDAKKAKEKPLATRVEIDEHGTVRSYSDRAEPASVRIGRGATRGWWSTDRLGYTVDNMAQHIALDVTRYGSKEVIVVASTGQSTFAKHLAQAIAAALKARGAAVPVVVPDPASKPLFCDFETIERRIAADLANKSDATVLALMYGTSLRHWWSPAYSWPVQFHTKDDSAAKSAVPAVPAPEPPRKIRELELWIHEDGSAGLYLPGTHESQRSVTPNIAERARMGTQDHVHGNYGFKANAAFLRAVGCRKLTLRRRRRTPVAVLTKWLTGLVNEHSPVMKIISDPEPLK